jgi:hypothetical protein
MDGKTVVEIIFTISSTVMIYLILRKPYIYTRLGDRRIRLDTYFLGALLGPVLLVVFGVLDYNQILRGLRGEAGLNPLAC